MMLSKAILFSALTLAFAAVGCGHFYQDRIDRKDREISQLRAAIREVRNDEERARLLERQLEELKSEREKDMELAQRDFEYKSALWSGGLALGTQALSALGGVARKM